MVFTFRESNHNASINQKEVNTPEIRLVFTSF